MFAVSPRYGVRDSCLYELLHEKICLRSFQPGQIHVQTWGCIARNFIFRNERLFYLGSERNKVRIRNKVHNFCQIFIKTYVVGAH